MDDVEAPVARLMAAYSAAVQARDINAFMRLYAAQARVFDAWGVWAYEDNAAWQLAVEGWFASHPGGRLQARFGDVQSLLTPGLALLSAVVTYSVVSAQGEPLNTVHNRLSWVLRPAAQGLKIVHEHTSAPIGFDDQKAILLRVKP